LKNRGQAKSKYPGIRMVNSEIFSPPTRLQKTLSEELNPVIKVSSFGKVESICWNILCSERTWFPFIFKKERLGNK